MPSQIPLPLHGGLIVDLFAGGGGASCGIEQALGRPVDIAINHAEDAIAMHAANHPHTRHYQADVFEVDPLDATRGRPVELLWASPSCTHFSRARGGVPVSRQLRSLGWVVVRWAAKTRPRIIMCENVPEWQDWGPVVNGQPCTRRRGRTFTQWLSALRALGYRVEYRELRACDYGAPTIRKRLFVIATRDGAPIHWPAPSHGPGKLHYRTMAECIDWSIPAPSIFNRARPLAAATCRRIARGIVRHVIEAAQPFIVPLRDASAQQALVAPTLITIDNQSSGGGAYAATAPLKTIVTENRHALVVAFLAKHYTGVVGSDLRQPIGTITAVDHHSLVTAHLTPPPANSDRVAAFLVSYYGNGTPITPRDPMPTATTRDRLGLVMVHGQPHHITDIGLRMLTPRELFTGQGFPADYQIECGANGKPLSKTAQTRMVGNSVCPPIAAALIAANVNTQPSRIAA